MASQLTRRVLLGSAGAGLLGSAVAAGGAEATKTTKIIAVSCSTRKGKTTATALQACLDSAKEAGATVEVELIELAGLKIAGVVAGGPTPEDDFPAIAAKLTDAKVGGIIIGSPVYFGNLTALCKAFLERWIAFRGTFALRNKVGGALAVGASRNGGQENTIHSIHAAMFAQDMILVGDGRPHAHQGATLWNNAKDDISKDEFGMSTARNLGKRVAEVAVRMG